MEKKLEYFNVEMVDGYCSMTPIIEKASIDIYFVGHRFEDDVSVNTLIKTSDFKASYQYKDCVVGKVAKDKFDLVVEFLRSNFISGYILWFDDSVDYSAFEFGKLFIENKKTCLLTSIYRATRVNNNYVIEIPDYLENKIMGMVFTESGENSLTLIQKL